jgi:hypothetical protein
VLQQPLSRELYGALAGEDVPQAVGAEEEELVLRMERVADQVGLGDQGTACTWWSGTATATSAAAGGVQNKKSQYTDLVHC